MKLWRTSYHLRGDSETSDALNKLRCFGASEWHQETDHLHKLIALQNTVVVDVHPESGLLKQGKHISTNAIFSQECFAMLGPI